MTYHVLEGEAWCRSLGTSKSRFAVMEGSSTTMARGPVSHRPYQKYSNTINMAKEGFTRKQSQNSSKMVAQP